MRANSDDVDDVTFFDNQVSPRWSEIRVGLRCLSQDTRGCGGEAAWGALPPDEVSRQATHETLSAERSVVAAETTPSSGRGERLPRADSTK
jgi:hypothetical protein